jgi:hypothetical protein
MAAENAIDLDRVAAEMVRGLVSDYGYAGHDVLRHRFAFHQTQTPDDLLGDEDGSTSLLGLLNTLLARCGLDRVVMVIGEGVSLPMTAITETTYKDFLRATSQDQAGQDAGQEAAAPEGVVAG